MRSNASRPHRDLKSAGKGVERSVIEMLSSLPTESLLEIRSTDDFEIPKCAIGGMVFERVKEQIRKDEVSPDNKNAISALAIAQGGRWKRLERIIVRASQKN
jgi:hypothetical protein